MKRFTALLICILLVEFALAAQEPDSEADRLADAVIRASGGENWTKVKLIRFTFNVEQDGKLTISVKHEWDIRSGTDTVTWNAKTVTVNLAEPGEDAEAQAAFQRWTNDSYWLLAPLKLKDAGVIRSRKAAQEIDGKTYEVLHLSFDHVGLTPGDHYNLYIDPETHLVRRWDYMPAPEKTIHATWDDYQEFDGLVLSTQHVIGQRRVFFTDIQVERDL